MGRLPQNFSPRLAPMPHQTEASQYIADSTIAALFDEQGLGKTKIVIDALCIAMRDGQIEGALVVAPLSLVYVWEQEVLKHSHLIPAVLRGSKSEKRYRFLGGANFYIINYESVVAELDRVKRFCRSRPVALVLDEAARIKNPETETTKALFELSPLSVKRILVTGTPVANKPVDVWAQYFFLDGGRLLGTDFAGFAAQYDERKPDYLGKLEVLRCQITSNSIRRTKADVLELPEKTFQIVPVLLVGRQLELYEQLRSELRIEVTNLEGERVVDEAENILKKLLRLVQIASNPYLIDKEYTETPAKFRALDGLVERIISQGEKVVVWSSFVDNIMLLKARLRQLNPLTLYGDIPTAERSRYVAKFQEVDKYRVLIANPAAAGEGITLTRASNAVYIDRSFSLTDYLQSQDRIHRISQTKPCTIYKLIAENTIDEYVDRIMDLKADIAGFVQGDSADINQTSVDTFLNKQELLRILGG
jgi:SWI/SNF-related matrix-associated actin-dependent regulator 1 of chromatin subfamily A